MVLDGHAAEFVDKTTGKLETLKESVSSSLDKYTTEENYEGVDDGRRHALKSIGAVGVSGITGIPSGKTDDDVPEDYLDEQVVSISKDDNDNFINDKYEGEGGFNFTDSDDEYLRKAIVEGDLSHLTGKDVRRLQAANRMGISHEEIGRFFDQEESEYTTAGLNEDTRRYADQALNAGKELEDISSSSNFTETILDAGRQMEEDALASISTDDNLKNVVDYIDTAENIAGTAEQLLEISQRADRAEYRMDTRWQVTEDWTYDLVTRLFDWAGEMYDEAPHKREVHDFEKGGRDELVLPDKDLLSNDEMTNLLVNTMVAYNAMGDSEMRIKEDGILVHERIHAGTAHPDTWEQRFPEAGKEIRPAVSNDIDDDGNNTYKITENDQGEKIIKITDLSPLDGYIHRNRDNRTPGSTSNDDDDDEGRGVKGDGEDGGTGTK